MAKAIVFTKKAKAIKYSSATPNVQQDSKDELLAVTDSKISLARKAESKLADDNTDANYFTVVTFNNSAQLNEFYQKLGLKLSDPQYIDGLALAKKLGIEITTPSRPVPGAFKINKRFKDNTL